MDQDFHLIEKYFRGELNEEELQLFNEKLQKDSAFEQDFRDVKFVREGAKESARLKALNILRDVESNLTEKETTKINVSMRRLVSIAASLIIIATVSYFAISNRAGGTMTGDEVFTAYYETYPNIVSGGVRGSDNIELNTLVARAYNAYDLKEYSTSVKLFEELLLKEKSAANYLYSGISNLEAGNYEIAKANFNTVINNFKELTEQSQWYLAMTLAKEGEVDQASANLAVLSASNSSYAKDANRALKGLGRTLVKAEGDGDIRNVDIIPPNHGGDSPDGSTFLDVRQYQIGKVRDLGTLKEYSFWNEVPIYDLEPGDLVEFVVVRSKSSSKSMAIILDKR